MVLIDASTRWSHVCLLSTCNDTFAKIISQVIKLQAHIILNIKSDRLDWTMLLNFPHMHLMIIAWL